MSYTGHIPDPQARAEEPSHIDLPRYVLVFRDNQPPGEHTFTSLSDDAAVEQMRKQYPRFAWALHHAAGDGVGGCFYHHPGVPAPAAAAAEYRDAAARAKGDFTRS